MPFVQGLAVRILTREDARAGNHSLVDAVLDIVKREKLSGVTVTRAVEGYSAHGGARSSTWADLGDDLPITIEIVDTTEQIQRALPEITLLVSEGALTVTDIKLFAPDVSA